MCSVYLRGIRSFLLCNWKCYRREKHAGVESTAENVNSQNQQQHDVKVVKWFRNNEIIKSHTARPAAAQFHVIRSFDLLLPNPLLFRRKGSWKGKDQWKFSAQSSTAITFPTAAAAQRHPTSLNYVVKWMEKHKKREKREKRKIRERKSRLFNIVVGIERSKCKHRVKQRKVQRLMKYRFSSRFSIHLPLLNSIKKLFIWSH